MAIKYREESLPAVSTFPFDISRWAGVNVIKGGQYDYEMSDCRNMSSDYFPYASPRKPRELIHSENNIQRIYKVEDGKIYFIDSDNKLCYSENGIKSYVTYTENDVEKTLTAPDCKCSCNYDNNTMFFPNMMYTFKGNEPRYLKNPFMFSGIFYDEEDCFKDEYYEYSYDKTYKTNYMSSTFSVADISVREIKVCMKLPLDDTYKLPESTTTKLMLVLRIYDAEGKTKKYTDSEGVEHLITSERLYITDRENSAVIKIPDGITLEKGDYFILRVGYFTRDGAGEQTEWANNMTYISTAEEWWLERTDNYEIITALPCDYGTVYNNRVVAVHGSDIRASALGDFSNFTEYADEAGNPSATGAYATDVGSAGDFTGICVYNNMIMMFKKDIVYEMYGSMPYTINELCSTGCIDNDSICEIDGVLYWASPKGIVKYSGGMPTVISHQININTNGICKAGANGRKYYVYDGDRIYVYDTYYQMWHIEDEKPVKMYFKHINDLYMLCDDGIYKVDSGNEFVEWEFTTKDYTFGSKERKTLSKLWIRADMHANTKLEVYVRQNGGEWIRSAVKTAEKDEMFDFKLRVKKCDSYAIKFKGRGDVRILDIHGKVTVGTSKHRGGLSLNVYRK